MATYDSFLSDEEGGGKADPFVLSGAQYDFSKFASKKKEDPNGKKKLNNEESMRQAAREAAAREAGEAAARSEFAASEKSKGNVNWPDGKTGATRSGVMSSSKSSKSAGNRVFGNQR